MNNIDYEHHFKAENLLKTYDETLIDPKDQIRRVVMMQLEGWLASKDFEDRVRAGDDFVIRLQAETKGTFKFPAHPQAKVPRIRAISLEEIGRNILPLRQAQPLPNKVTFEL
jgi:hypothetical protein